MPTESFGLNYNRGFRPMRGFTAGGGAMPSQSSGYSQSESGDYYTPQQQARMDQLYPLLFQRLQESMRPSSGSQGFSSLLQAVGGTPTQFSPAAVGAPLDYGRPADFALGGVAGGAVGAYPDITAGNIWDDQRVQERVNLGKAQSEQAVAGQQQAIADRMAALGYGSASPLAQALTANLAAVNLAGQTQAENTLRWNAAQGNAQHLLASQQAAVERARALGDEDIRRRGLTSQDDIQRRQLAAADELQRRHLTGTERWQREQFAANEQFRNRQAGDESDIRRRELTLRKDMLDTESRTNQSNALLQGMMSMLRPQQRSTSRSEQSSGTGGYPGAPGTRSYAGRGGLFQGSSFLRA